MSFFLSLACPFHKKKKLITLSVLPAELDENLRLAAVVDLNKDLGVLVALVSEALEVTAVVEQVDGQAESQHAQYQQAHVYLRLQIAIRPLTSD